ncbi:MAG: glycosyltransferase family 2 protein [Patescibacteria group bacterium]
MIKKALTVSVIIPVYNEESYIRGCLESLAKQVIKPDQVIVVDNNSNDNSKKIAQEFSFVTIISENRQGLYFARQTGVQAATSNIICRIDADTYVEKHWVAEIKRAFRNDNVQAATGPVGYHDMPFPRFTRKVEDMCLRLARIGKYEFLMGANMAFRRSAWNLVEPELCNEPFLFEDIDIAIHLKEHGIRPTYLPTMLAAVSSRRFEDTPNAFMRYIGGHTRTLEYHDLRTPVGAHFAEGAFALTYFGIKPLHMSFDPKARRPSLKYFLQKRIARPDPMRP